MHVCTMRLFAISVLALARSGTIASNYDFQQANNNNNIAER